MKETFSYSILQYKHSLLLREAVNVAILFSFPAQARLHFVAGNSYRVKSIYPDFDQGSFNSIIRSIETRLKSESHSLFLDKNAHTNLSKTIHERILPEDSTVLQFTEPVFAIQTWDSHEKVIKKYSELLLPGILTHKAENIRHNEHFLLKKYLGYIFETETYARNKEIIENRIRKNQVVQYKGVSLKFDAAWKNGSLNLVKPISFDLKEGQDIQSKSAQFFGYLTLLKDYAKRHNYRFDLILAKPQDNVLEDHYRKAVNILKGADAPKRLITEAELPSYSEETLEHLIEASNN